MKSRCCSHSYCTTQTSNASGRCAAHPLPERPTSRYLLPDGRIVNIFDDVAREAYFCSFTLENGRIVSAVRLPKAKKL